MSKKNPTDMPPELHQEILKMSGLFQNTRINYHVLDTGGRICYVNQPWIKALGYSRDEAIGMTFSEIIAESSMDAFQKRFRDCDLLEASDDIELVILCADGSEMVASFSCFCISTDRDTERRYHCTFQNITRLRLAEKALRISESRYKRIFNSFRDVYYQADLESHIVLVSPSIRSLGGYEPEELIGRSLADFFPSQELRAAFREELIGKGFVDDYDLNIKHKKGHFVDVSISAQIVQDSENNPRFVEGVIRDISRRKQFELEISNYRARLEEVTAHLPVILFQIIQTNGEFTLEYLSPNVNKWLDHTPDEIIENSGIIEDHFGARATRDLKREFVLARDEKRSVEMETRVNARPAHEIPVRIRATFREKRPDKIIWTGILQDISREMEDQELIREQEQQLHILYNYAKIGIGNMNLKGITTSVNQTILDTTGYSNDDLVGRHFSEHPQYLKKDMPRYWKLFKNALSGQVPDEGVMFKYRTKEGDEKWAEAFLSLKRKNGKITGFQGLFVDSTDRVLKDKSQAFNLWASDFLFKSADGFLKLRSEGELFDFLDKQLRILMPDAIINLNSLNAELNLLTIESVSGLSKTLRSKILQILGSMLKGKTFEINASTFSYARESKLIRTHGSLYDLTLHQIPEELCNRLEKLIHLREIHEISMGVGSRIMGGCAIFLCRDQEIAHPELVENLFRIATSTLSQLRTHQLLKQKEEHYRSLAENTRNIIARLNKGGKVIYTNPAFNTTFGFIEKEVRDKNLRELGLPSVIGNLLQDTVEQTLKTEQAQTCECAIHLNECVRFLEWRTFPENSGSDPNGGVLVFAYDITDRRNMAVELLEKIEHKNKLFRLIGHDLSNPFNSMLGFLQLIIDRYDHLDDTTRKAYLRNIQSSSQNLNNLLYSLREWTRENENNSTHMLNFDARQSMESCLAVLKLNIQQKNLQVYNNIAEGILLTTDYNMITSAFRNILSNAIKFSLTDGVIQIGSSTEGNNACIEIQDQGIGMSNDELDQLQDSKQNFTKEGTGGESGSGFGFRIAREFIEMNKGSIRVKSSPGKGTLVSLCFPMPGSGSPHV